jgi:hypothetical protein
MPRALVTYFQSKYQPVLEFVLSRLTHYAKKCNAVLETIKIRDDSIDPQMDKFFHIGDNFAQYDQIAVVDVDILIRKDAPDIFSWVGPNRIGVYNEGATHLNSFGHNRDEETIRWVTVAQMIKLCNLPPIPLNKSGSWDNPFFYFNSGVVVLGQKHREIYSNFTPLERDNCYANARKVQCSEQALVNYSLFKCGFPIVSLPNCFNQMAYNRDSNYLDTAFFSHYAGMPIEEKFKQMVSDHKKWESWGY